MTVHRKISANLRHVQMQQPLLDSVFVYLIEWHLLMSWRTLGYETLDTADCQLQYRTRTCRNLRVKELLRSHFIIYQQYIWRG